MPEVEGYRYVEAEFTREGACTRRAAPTRSWPSCAGAAADRSPGAVARLEQRHGGGARPLPAPARQPAQLGGGPARRGRLLAVLGVLWPSKKFADESVIPGGGVASAGEPGRGPAGGQARPAEGHPAAGVRGAARGGEVGPRRARAGARGQGTVRRPPAPSARPRPRGRADAADQFFGQDPEELFAGLEVPILLQALKRRGRRRGRHRGTRRGTDDGGAAGLAEFASGIAAAANRLLNYATYYQMKARAGVAGQGLAGLLEQIRASGRSCACTSPATASAPAWSPAAALASAASVRPASLTLLQGAFSHNGFSGGFPFGGATGQGFFRAVVAERRIDGPIVVTHTANDRAVGVAYAIASRLAQQTNADLGDAADVFGGIGRNGAVHTAESEAGTLLPPGERYRFRAGTIHNLRADRFVADHGDVTNPAVANAPGGDRLAGLTPRSRRPQHRRALGRQVGQRHRLGRRTRRPPRLVAEPPGESWPQPSPGGGASWPRHRLARRAGEAHVEVAVVAPPGADLGEPGPVAAGHSAQGLLDAGVDEDAGDVGVQRAADQRDVGGVSRAGSARAVPSASIETGTKVSRSATRNGRT